MQEMYPDPELMYQAIKRLTIKGQYKEASLLLIDLQSHPDFSYVTEVNTLLGISSLYLKQLIQVYSLDEAERVEIVAEKLKENLKNKTL